jgi:two-component system, OmpR family, phosphate regulon sensor histidine kinase PhoR
METVLVVDDEKVIRDGCSRVLSLEGLRVVTASDGEEALNMLRSESVNAVLCGLKMPGMSALELLEEVHGRYSDLPLIIITGEGTVANAVECIRKGAYDFITKPSRVDHLSTVVKRAVAHLPPLPRCQDRQL